MIKLEEHEGIVVLRDDLLPGGTKSVLLDKILPMTFDKYVYATPVYGGFQIALAIWCKNNNKKCILFCAKRKVMHPNTLRAISEGAIVMEVEHGYLSVVEKRASEFMDSDGNQDAYKIPWGSHNEQSIGLISERAENVIAEFKGWPDVIFIALGSGMITEGILLGTQGMVTGNPLHEIEVHAVEVGAEYLGVGLSNPRLVLHKYYKSFDKVASVKPPFPSMPNYDAKAWEMAKQYKFINPDKKVLFWNVL